MKKTFVLLLVLLIIISTLSGCTGFEISEEEQRFIGTWISKPSNDTILSIVVKDDKSAEVRINACDSEKTINEEILFVSGYWRVDEDLFLISYGANLTSYTIRFQIRDDTLQTTWMGNYILHMEP